MKKIFYSIVALFSLFTMASCQDMLEVDNDSMVQDPDLNQKTDSVFYALGVAQAMQQLADQYFFIGEMRGDLVTTTSTTDNNLRQLADYSATTTNKYDSAYVYYRVINNCNYYLANRDTTLYTGATNVAINEYAAIAAYRAWAYLQLARTYGGNEEGVPFFTEPLTTISQINDNTFPKLKLSEIVAELAPSLEKFTGLAVPTFGTTEYSIGTTNWGYARTINPANIFIPVDVVLGEMYLEDGQWLNAAKHYAKYLTDNELISYSGFAMSGIMSGGMGFDEAPDDFSSEFNVMSGRYMYGEVFNGQRDQQHVSLIPMAVSSLRGVTTNVPAAFGYDYYSLDRSSSCPTTDNIQVVPSQAYVDLTRNSEIYYYPMNTRNSALTYPDTVKYYKSVDGRGAYTKSNRNASDEYILAYEEADTTKVRVTKVRGANIHLYRRSTIYLHMAEALNRLGYTDLAFAVLRNGISTSLETLVPSEEVEYSPVQYVTQEGIDLLKGDLLFLNVTNREVFDGDNIVGLHSMSGHSNSTRTGSAIEDGRTVRGSFATAVGSSKNMHYLPQPIIGAKMAEIAEKYNVAVGTTKQDSINAMEDILCDEYAKEFAFEGTRFYDLQRMARHKNESGLYGGNFGSQWFAKKLEGNNPSKSLLEPKNWYLPFK